MMRFFLFSLTLALLSAFSAAAQGWSEPARGSAERRAVLDAIRPIAAWHLGDPVEFIVEEMRVTRDLAFAQLTAQRPGGATIDLAYTPMAFHGMVDVTDRDGPRLDVLYKRSGGQWVPVLYEIGATEAWWVWQPVCEDFYAVIADYCAR